MVNAIKVLCGLTLFTVIYLSSISAHSAISDAALMATAESRGSVRVILHLGAPYKTEGLHASQQSIQNQRQDISNRQETVLSQIAGLQVSDIKRYATVPYMAMAVNEQALQALINSPNIISIEEDVPERVSLTESKPHINADDVHTQGFGGSGQTIAILDTGVRKTHWDLDDGKVVSEACYSTTLDTDVSTLCPNGLSSQVGSGAGVNCDPEVDSGCSHGTHVAGIAAGTWNGIAPEANIIAMQVFSLLDSAFSCSPQAPPCVRSYPSDQMLALERVYALRDTYTIAAVNMSIGGSIGRICDRNSRKPIIDNLLSVGIATVISAGNDGYDGSVGVPACISTAITVGATLDNEDTIANYSNHAIYVDVLAPGSSITSSVAAGDTAYATWDGTSMAAPHVAGAFALIRDKRPDWSIDFIESRLESTGVNVSRAGVTKPRIDVLEAIKASDLVVLNTSVSDSTVNPQQTITIAATAKNQGGASASDYSTLRYYRSADSTISSSDTLVDTDQVSPLSPGSTHSLISTALTGPQNAGSYYYGACVDALEGEAPTNNNCSVGIEVVLTAFDYSVQSPAVSNNDLLPGQTFTLSAIVVNDGNILSPSTTLRYYRSLDATITTDDTLEGTDAVSNLPGLGGQSAESIVLNAPTGGGVFYYGACVDSKNLELASTNNCSVGVPVTASSLPDVTIVSPAVSNDIVPNGDSFTLSGTVANIGDTSVNSFFLRYFRSSDTFITLQDTDIGLGSLGGLSSGASANFSKAFNTSGTPPETYYYGVCAALLSNAELHTNNNCSTGIQVTITAVDLLVQSAAVNNANLNPGQLFVLSAAVYNQGDATAAATTLHYYRSLDSIISDEDISVGTDSVASLNPSNSGPEGIKLAAPAAGGDYYYGSCVDAVAGELDIANNCSLAVPVSVFINADSYEDDNSSGLATTIDEGSTQSHNINVVGDADWLKFKVTEAVTNIEIETSGSGSDDTTLVLYDSALEEVAFDQAPDSYATIALAELAAGTYYILVNENGNDKSIGSYTISLSYSEAYSNRKFCFPAKSNTGDDVYICLH